MKPNKSKKNTKKISFDFNKFKDIIIKNRYLVLLIVGLIGLFAVVFGVSYAFFTNSVTSKDFVVYTGNLAVTYEKKTNVININNAIPMSNANGLATTPYSFDVKNTGTIVSKYQVRLELDNNNTLPLEDVKISVYRNDIEYLKPTRISDLNATLVIADDGLLSPTESDNYKIRLWVDLGAGNDAVGKEFKAKIVIDGLQNVEEGYTFNTRPIITLNKDSNGNTHISLVKGNTYNELGAYSVRDDKDVLLRSNVSVSYEYFDGTNLNTVNNINNTTLNNVGIYYATYSISDSSNLEGKAVRVITVNNTPVLPTISLNGNSSMEVYQNDVFVDPGVTVGTGVNVLTLGEVKTSVPGIYIIRYIAIDSNGNLNSVTRSVEVLENYAESILNGADPVLTDNLVPVTIDDDGTIKKANTNSKWYEYGNKNWANAVVLVDDTITYNNGATIPESNIQSYFVWIPKYSYQIWDLGNYNSLTTLDNTKPHTIPIRFGLDDTNDSNSGECTTPMTSGASGNCQVGDYMTHPAFVSMNTNGIWVGKFKTTGTVDNITVKPNAVSLRNINVNQMFTAAYNYKRSIDSHMMKNTEWGAITYLSYSNYGINDKIEANSNSSYLTGYNGQNSTYNTSSGYLASSTGNITGIYDMNGPSQEYMAAYISNNQGSAGFGADPISLYDQKYFDIYNASSNETTYQYRILGDATGEMGPFTNSSNIYVGSWHNGYSKFVYSLNPWFGRSSNIGSENYGSQSVFGRDNGRALNWQSFRIVLVPESYSNLKANYGDTIPAKINNLYYTVDDDTSSVFTALISDSNFSGNYDYAVSFRELSGLKELYFKRDVTPVTTIGINTFSLNQKVSNNWISLFLNGGCTGPNPKIIGNIKFNFEDNQSLTIEQSVNNGYIEPLVAYGSSSTYSYSDWVYGNLDNTLSGGNSTGGNYSRALYLVKIKNKSPLTGISFYTDKEWGSCNSIYVEKYPEKFNISLSPFVTN